MTIYITDPREAINMLRIVANQLQRQGDAVVDEAVSLVKECELPWPIVIKDRLSFMNMRQAEKVLFHHPGRDLHIIWQSLDNLLNIFRLSSEILQAALDNFHNQAQTPSFFSRKHINNFENVCLHINKCIYDLASVSIAIRDISRRFKGKFNPEGYIDRYDAVYTNNPIHHFILGLRKTLQHEHFAVAYYSMIQREGIWETEFNLSSEELLIYGDFDLLAKTLICGERVKIRPIFEQYNDQVLSFYNWVKLNLDNDLRFADYQECKAIPKKAATRKWYEILLLQLEAKKFDPYDHLQEYFTEQEMDEINKFPYRSREQVDKIIELYDRDDVCTNVIRSRIYKLCDV